MDPNRLGEWVTIHRTVKVRSSDPSEPGARMDQVLHILGVSFKVHWTLDSRLSLRGRPSGTDAGPRFHEP